MSICYQGKMPQESPDPIMDDSNLKPQGVHLQTMSLEEANEYPVIKNLEVKVQQVLALTAFGFSPKTIGKAWGCKGSSIKDIIRKYDPENKFSISKHSKRAFLTKMLEARAAEALAYITPEKLEASNAYALASIAEKMLRTINLLEPRESTRIMVGSVTDIMNRLKQKPIELVRNEDGSYGEQGGGDEPAADRDSDITEAEPTGEQPEVPKEPASVGDNVLQNP